MSNFAHSMRCIASTNSCELSLPSLSQSASDQIFPRMGLESLERDMVAFTCTPVTNPVRAVSSELNCWMYLRFAFGSIAGMCEVSGEGLRL